MGISTAGIDNLQFRELQFVWIRRRRRRRLEVCASSEYTELSPPIRYVKFAIDIRG
jgi:hypothetical protein